MDGWNIAESTEVFGGWSLGQAELCAKKMNGRGIYQTIGQAYLEAGNFDKALEMHLRMKNTFVCMCLIWCLHGLNTGRRPNNQYLLSCCKI